LAKKKAPPGNLSEQQELRQLASAPLVDLSGVVDGDAGGSRSQGEKAWTVMFRLKPWRVKGGEVRESALFVRTRPLSEKEMNRLRRAIRPWSVIKLRARLVERSVFGRPAALVKQFGGADRADAELRQRAKELKKPVAEKDGQFGKLTLDRRMGWYEGKARWNGRPAKLYLEAEEPEHLAGALKTARPLWKSQAAWQKRIEKLAVKELLADRNGAWLTEGEKPVTAAQFVKRMKLESVTANPDGSFSFWHDDGGLFWGHAIQVTGNLKEGLTGVDTPG
jgi:hypothetical protein